MRCCTLHDRNLKAGPLFHFPTGRLHRRLDRRASNLSEGRQAPNISPLPPCFAPLPCLSPIHRSSHSLSLLLSLPILSSSSSSCPHPLLLPPAPLLLFPLLLASSFGLVLSSSSILRLCCRFLVVAFLLCRHPHRYTTLVPLSIPVVFTSTSVSLSSSRIANVRPPSRPRIESLSTVRFGVHLCPALQHQPDLDNVSHHLISFVPQRAAHLSHASPPQPSSPISDKTPLSRC